MLALSLSPRPMPRRANRQYAGEGIEAALVADHGAVVRLPPITNQKTSDDTIPTATMPYECATRPENARELVDDARVICGLNEETKGREEIQNDIESAGPSLGEATHVTPRIAKMLSRSACTGACE